MRQTNAGRPQRCAPVQLSARLHDRDTWLAGRGNVEVVLDQKDERGAKAQLLEDLELTAVLDRDVEHLSGAPHAPSARPCMSLLGWGQEGGTC